MKNSKSEYFKKRISFALASEGSQIIFLMVLIIWLSAFTALSDVPAPWDSYLKGKESSFESLKT